MSVSAGIVGLPNVGKSTIFNALTRAGAQSANYPFCTIDPNVGIVQVPDARLQLIEKYVPAQKIIPSTVDIVDIAGLVRGASQGEGLGNQFLANIRETDAILHVVRCFDDENVIHVEDRVNPRLDVEIIDTELMLADLQSIERRIDKSRRVARSGDKLEAARVVVLERILNALEEGNPARSLTFDEAEMVLVKQAQLLTSKPVLYVANVSEDDLTGQSPYVTELRALAEAEGSGLVIVSGAIEEELIELEGEELTEMLEGLGIVEPALNVLIRATNELLGLHCFFTAGEQEIRSWTIPVGATAPQAAGVIHSDFEKRFIRAEVHTVADLVEYKNEAGIRAAGKQRLEGKTYIVVDGDILNIRHDA